MINYVLPLINLCINGFLLFKLSRLLSSYLEFEYVVLALFFLFFVMVSISALFKSIFTFMAKKRTFNLLFLVQFGASILIIQPLGWLFSIYLTFVFMLIYLVITKQNNYFNFFLEMCGITVGGLFLYINFYQ